MYNTTQHTDDGTCVCGFCLLDLFITDIGGLTAPISATDLYRLYCGFAANLGKEPLSQKLFGGYLTRAGIQRQRTGKGYVYAAHSINNAVELLAADPDRHRAARRLEGLLQWKLRQAKRIVAQLAEMLYEPENQVSWAFSGGMLKLQQVLRATKILDIDPHVNRENAGAWCGGSLEAHTCNDTVNGIDTAGSATGGELANGRRTTRGIDTTSNIDTANGIDTSGSVDTTSGIDTAGGDHGDRGHYGGALDPY